MSAAGITADYADLAVHDESDATRRLRGRYGGSMKDQQTGRIVIQTEIVVTADAHSLTGWKALAKEAGFGEDVAEWLWSLGERAVFDEQQRRRERERTDGLCETLDDSNAAH